MVVIFLLDICVFWLLEFVPCACCAGGVVKVQRFKDVLQQCACHRNRGSVAVLQTRRKSVIHKNIQRPVVS